MLEVFSIEDVVHYNIKGHPEENVTRTKEEMTSTLITRT